MKNKYTLRIGREEGNAGAFLPEKKAIVLSIVLNSNDNTDALERVIFISGCKYEHFNNEKKTTYIVECKSIEQIKRLTPVIERSSSKYNHNVTVEIGDECEEFFKKYAGV